VFDLRQRSGRTAPAISTASSTEDEIQIFERLRGRDRGESGVERKLVEIIAEDLLRRIDDEGPVTAAPESKSSCCSCCSAGPKVSQ
jgi:hypothetical protein